MQITAVPATFAPVNLSMWYELNKDQTIEDVYAAYRRRFGEPEIVYVSGNYVWIEIPQTDKE